MHLHECAEIYLDIRFSLTCDGDGAHGAGNATLEEDIADLAGLRIAYAAMTHDSKLGTDQDKHAHAKDYAKVGDACAQASQ